eukprot:3477921-Alexandrium_andersonii.AAC.1
MRCSFLRIAAAHSVVRFALAMRPRFARAFGARALLGSGARHRSPVAALLIVFRAVAHHWLPARRSCVLLLGT